MNNLYDVILSLKKDIDNKIINSIFTENNTTLFKLFKMIDFIDKLFTTIKNIDEPVIQNNNIFKLKLYAEYIKILKQINIIQEKDNNIYKFNKIFVDLYLKENDYENKHRTFIYFLDKYLHNLLGVTKKELFDLLYNLEYISNFEYIFFVKNCSLSIEEKIYKIQYFRKYLNTDKYYSIIFYYLKKEEPIRKLIKKSLEDFYILKFSGFQLYNLDFFGILFLDTSNDIKHIRKIFRKIEKINNIEEKFEKIKEDLKNIEYNKNLKQVNNVELIKFIHNYYLNKKHKKLLKIKEKYNLKHNVNDINEDWDYHHIIPLHYGINNNNYQQLLNKAKETWNNNNLNIDIKNELLNVINDNLKDLNNIDNIIYIDRKIHEKIHKNKLFIIEDITKNYIILTDVDKKNKLTIYNDKNCIYKKDQKIINKIKKLNSIYQKKFLT